MTVFGFGRKYQSFDGYLNKTPAHFTIALREFAESRLEEYK